MPASASGSNRLQRQAQQSLCRPAEGLAGNQSACSMCINRPAGCRHSRGLPFQLPALAVFLAPERGGFLRWVFELLLFAVEFDGAAGAIGDVAEVAEQGAALAFLGRAVERFSVANGIGEILEMGHVGKRRRVF